jgi:hypothetical protein
VATVKISAPESKRELTKYHCKKALNLEKIWPLKIAESLELIKAILSATQYARLGPK